MTLLISPMSALRMRSALQKTQPHQLLQSSPAQRNGFSRTLSRPAFGRHLTEGPHNHMNYLGAHYDAKTDSTTFRVFASFAEKMLLQVAPDTKNYKYFDADSPAETRHVWMQRSKDDARVFEVTVDKVRPGDNYRFVLTNAKGEQKSLKDPRTQYQPNDAFGWSSVYDHNEYQWHDKGWQSPFRHVQTGDHGGIPAGMVMQEINIGTLGGYKKAMQEIDRMAAEGICNTVEVMPIGETFGRHTWGFDEVDKYAPEQSNGTPDEFKAFVDYAHRKNISVVLHVVPNHFGPFGTAVHEFGEAFSQHKTEWGNKLNFEEKNCDYMRNFMVDMTMGWVRNYHVDGLRVDAVHEMDSDKTAKLMAAELRSHPETAGTILIGEHIGKTKRMTASLEAEAIRDPEKMIRNADTGANPRAISRLGFNAVEYYDVKNVVTALLMGWHFYDDGPNIQGLKTGFDAGSKVFDDYGKELPLPAPTTNITYITSHDELNIFGGTRLIPRIMATRLGLTMENRVTSPNGVNKKPFLQTQALIKLHLDPKTNNDSWLTGQQALNINPLISRERFNTVYHKAQAMNRLATGTLFMHPGQKRIFMGDQRGELAPYKFNAEYPADAVGNDGRPLMDVISDEKGYRLGDATHEESQLDQKAYTDPVLRQQMTHYSQRLAGLCRDIPALNNGSFEHQKTAIDPKQKLLMVHRWEGASEVVGIMNYGEENRSYPVAQFGDFPSGQWHEILNSNDGKYGGNDQYMNAGVKISHDSMVQLPKHSLVILTK